MISYVYLPDSEKSSRPLPFYLAMEEWLARKGREGESYFFMWQVEPTVIFGRNQEVSKEVNIDYCRSHDIRFYRRKSGGGCVYADMDNIMFSYITPSASVQTTFSEYAGRVAEMLRSLGLDAEASGRNDVAISGKKVSGNAFYHIPGRSIVHGTMLFSTDMENMLNAITPSKSKLESKKVTSVESHITTISRHLPHLSINDFKSYAANYMADSQLTLSEEDIREIEKIAEPYFTPQWIFGHELELLQNPETSYIDKKADREKISTKGTDSKRTDSKGTDSKRTDSKRIASKRIEGVGEFLVSMTIDDESRIIRDINFQGDFFLLGDIENAIFSHIRGTRADRESISNAISGINPKDLIANLSREDLESLILAPIQE